MKKNITVKQLGEMVRKARKSQGLTQTELAGVGNVGLRFIVDLEKGKETAQIGKVLHILNSLGLSLTVEGADDV